MNLVSYDFPTTKLIHFRRTAKFPGRKVAENRGGGLLQTLRLASGRNALRGLRPLRPATGPGVSFHAKHPLAPMPRPEEPLHGGACRRPRTSLRDVPGSHCPAACRTRASLHAGAHGLTAGPPRTSLRAGANYPAACRTRASLHAGVHGPAAGPPRASLCAEGSLPRCRGQGFRHAPGSPLPCRRPTKSFVTRRSQLSCRLPDKGFVTRRSPRPCRRPTKSFVMRRGLLAPMPWPEVPSRTREPLALPPAGQGLRYAPGATVLPPAYQGLRYVPGGQLPPHHSPAVFRSGSPLPAGFRSYCFGSM